MRIVALSDTHGMHGRVDVPDGDILIHCGDLTAHGEPEELMDFASWLDGLPHLYKVVIAGNHDFCLHQRQESRRVLSSIGAFYLQDQQLTIYMHGHGLRIYGSPWTPEYGHWAFMLPRQGQALMERWDQIPEGLDILVTHGPPVGQGDLTYAGDRAGCAMLASRLIKASPTLHLFGHIHEGYGVDPRGRWANVSVCDRNYRPVNPPLVIDWEKWTEALDRA